MSTYLVRLKDREPDDMQAIVGMIAATSVMELWDMVDEITSPTECEYARLPRNGGMLWAGGYPGTCLQFTELLDEKISKLKWQDFPSCEEFYRWLLPVTPEAQA